MIHKINLVHKLYDFYVLKYIIKFYIFLNYQNKYQIFIIFYILKREYSVVIIFDEILKIIFKYNYLKREKLIYWCVFSKRQKYR